MADPFIQQLFLSPWSGAPARGQLPQVPQRPALPTAVAELAGCLVRIPGASGVADATYECQKQADDSYAWVQIDGGGGNSALLGIGTQTGSQSGITSSFTNITGLSIPVTLASKRYIRFTFYGLFTASVADAITSYNAPNGVGSNFGGQLVAPTAGGYVTESVVQSVNAGTWTFTFQVGQSSGTLSVSSFQLVMEDLGVAP